MNDLAVKILSSSGTNLFFLGQAGFVFKSKKGTLLGLDMYLSNCVERAEGHIGFKRLIPSPLSPSELVFDYIIATHPHYDHFDFDSIPLLMSNRHTKLFASVNCAAELKKLGMTDENAVYIKPGDFAEADDIHLEFVSCDHSTGAPDAVGVVVTVDGKRIYFAGDTCLHTEWADKLGNIDIMIAPINGAFGNLNEAECVQLAKALRPKLTVPCHYGMFASHGGNPGLFIKNMEKETLPYYLMTVGEKLAI